MYSWYASLYQPEKFKNWKGEFGGKMIYKNFVNEKINIMF